MPPRTDDEFWDTRKDWSQRKHLILGYYLTPAIAKLRVASPDRRVFILDGFAGRGQYGDDKPGSPLLTGRLADEYAKWSDPIDLKVFNVEADRENFRELQDHTAGWVQRGVTRNLEGTFQQHLPFVLREAGRSPLFVFLDPFRPTDLPFADFAPLLARSEKTELCFIFHSHAVYRIIQAVRPVSQTADDSKRAMRATLDQIFGSSRWQALLSSPALDPDEVVEAFKEELRMRAGPRRAYVVAHAIRAGYAAGLKYHIVFLTRHPDGLRLMNDAFCKETETAYQQAGRADQLNLELDVSMPPVEMPQTQRLDVLTETLIEIGRSSPAQVWKRSDLVLESISRRFGEFSQRLHLQAVKHLLIQKTPPRLADVGEGSKQSTRARTNDRTLMRFEL